MQSSWQSSPTCSHRRSVSLDKSWLNVPISKGLEQLRPDQNADLRPKPNATSLGSIRLGFSMYRSGRNSSGESYSSWSIALSNLLYRWYPWLIKFQDKLYVIDYGCSFRDEVTIASVVLRNGMGGAYRCRGIPPSPEGIWRECWTRVVIYLPKCLLYNTFEIGERFPVVKSNEAWASYDIVNLFLWFLEYFWVSDHCQ